MAQLSIFNLLEVSTYPLNFLENYSTNTVKNTNPQLSAIWVKEFDGEQEYLVARWVKQD